MARDNTQAPQTLIYTRQGGTERCFESGAFLWFVDELFSAENFRTALDNCLNMSILGMADVSRVEGCDPADATVPPVLNSRLGYVIFSVNNDVSEGSIIMCSGYSGQVMYLMTRGAAGMDDGSIVVQCGGHGSGLGAGAWVETNDSDTLSISVLRLYGSDSAHAYVKLVNYDGLTWSIVEYGNKSQAGSRAKELTVVHVAG